LVKLVADREAKRAALMNFARDKYYEKAAPHLLAHDDSSAHNRVLDFHGYSRQEALKKLQSEFVAFSHLITHDWSVKLITGRGNHSTQKGFCVIHRDVMNWLNEHSLAFEEGLGHIIVRANASITGKSSGGRKLSIAGKKYAAAVVSNATYATKRNAIKRNAIASD
jgi:hypothetical protein